MMESTPDPRLVIGDLELECEGIKTEMEEIDDQIKGFTRDDRATPIGVADWMMGMDEDLEAIEEEIHRRDAQFQIRRKSVVTLEDRYHKLQPIVTHGIGKLADAGESQADVDELLRQIPRKDGRLEESKKDQVKAIEFANVELEDQIAKLQKEIGIGIQGMGIERNKLRQQIERQRAMLSMREREIIDEMHQLRLKIAQRKQK
jgi:hypothetical protein